MSLPIDSGFLYCRDFRGHILSKGDWVIRSIGSSNSSTGLAYSRIESEPEKNGDVWSFKIRTGYHTGYDRIPEWNKKLGTTINPHTMLRIVEDEVPPDLLKNYKEKFNINDR
jgi:hypothetical protein